MERSSIDTEYNGYRFRSRTEARWAVFFDALGVRYEYEKEGYNLPSGKYLPDFWLEDAHRWVEIKSRGLTPNDGINAILKAGQLSEVTGNDVLLVVGRPYPGEYHINIFHPGQTMYRPGVCDEPPSDLGMPFVFAECPKCDRELWLYNDVRQQTVIGDATCKGGIPLPDGTLILRAYNAASHARFEWGETPSGPRAS